jgi:hypothetical protein
MLTACLRPTAFRLIAGDRSGGNRSLSPNRRLLTDVVRAMLFRASYKGGSIWRTWHWGKNCQLSDLTGEDTLQGCEPQSTIHPAISSVVAKNRILTGPCSFPKYS